jgi:hypothetical protein
MKNWRRRIAGGLAVCVCLVSLAPAEICSYAASVSEEITSEEIASTETTETTETTEGLEETEATESPDTTENPKPSDSTEKPASTESTGKKKDKNNKNNKKKTKSPVLSKKKLEVKRGKTKKLSVKNTSKKVKWSSANKKIATVSSKGVVTGVGCGTVKVTARVGGKKLTCRVTVYASKKYVSKWVEKNGRFYYYNKYGEKLTGMRTIGKKTYYFDSKGRQRTGWVQVKGSYYFFTISNKGKGSLVKSTKVNGIAVNSKGKAKVTAKTKEKIRLLTAANEMVFEKTKSTMTKSEKLKIMFTGLAKGNTIVYKNLGSFRKNESRWDEFYAAYFFDFGYGDCYTVGAALAYLATAIGYEDVYAQSSGSHGWCKIDGKYYDPNWAWWGTSNIEDAYAVPAEMSGKNKSPNWAKYGAYSKKISG